MSQIAEAAATDDLDAWIIRPPAPGRVRLFCLPPAGAGAATFRLWSAELPPSIGVYRFQPPGRENRFREKFCTSPVQYVDYIARLIEAEPEPYAIFGHSMGALAGYAAACRVAERSGREPLHLFVSAFRSPASTRPAPIHDLPEPEFIEALRLRYDGIPRAVLDNAEVLQMMLPIVRGDLALLHALEVDVSRMLDCPVTALGGDSDPWVGRADLEAWSTVTRGPFSVHVMPGGHFYLANSVREIAARIAQGLGH